VASRSSGVSFSSDPKSKQREEESAETIVLRSFGGINTQSPRENIADDEFYWLEELIPISAGNLAPVLGPGSNIVTISGETGAPSLTVPFSSVGVDSTLAIWSNTGNAWVGTMAAPIVWTKVATGLFTSGKTAATPWSNLGFLIVDPVAGYYDYGVTAANTFTNLSGQLYGPAMTATTPAQLATATVPALRVVGAPGSGGTIGASASVVEISITAAGTGYSAGDLLVATGGTLTTSSSAPASQQNQPLILSVTTINTSTGAVTGISLTSVGYYHAGPANAIAFTGGTGTGFTGTATWAVANPYLITPGQAYVAPVVQAFIGGVWVAYAMSVFTSGTLLGTAIATYAGRVWIAIDRTVQFTDALSYNSFANSGSAFTINDSYLHNNITALFAANNYLYIFGDDSIDILSNVTVVSGIAQFSRINASSSVGTTQPNSIFPFLRGLAFCNNSGFYVISGATPEKASDKLDGLIASIVFSAPVYGCQVMVENILCAAFLISFKDSFVRSPTQTRSILAVRFRDRWWLTSQLPATGVNLGAVFSLPINGLSTMFGWSGNTLFKLLSEPNINPWLLKTKLWDAQTPILDKQMIDVGFGAVFAGASTPGFTLTVDTEFTSIAVTLGRFTPIVQWVNNSNQVVQWTNNAGQIVQWEIAPIGYRLLTGPANSGAGKYAGITVTGGTNVTQIRMLALELERRRRW
jgi:hypothetical protein